MADEEPRYRNEDWLREQYWESNHTLQEIAEECDSCAATILYWMRKHDIPRRSDEPRRLERASYSVWKDGYAYWSCGIAKVDVRVHRLLAVSEYGFDSVKGRHVHHKNEIPWDNRPDNIEILSPEEHAKLHADTLEPTVKVDQETCDEIREFAGMYTQEELALMYRVSQATVSIHVNGKCSHGA